jgi:hypothetical protein
MNKVGETYGFISVNSLYVLVSKSPEKPAYPFRYFFKILVCKSKLGNIKKLVLSFSMSNEIMALKLIFKETPKYSAL